MISQASDVDLFQPYRFCCLDTIVLLAPDNLHVY
mgnify:CR=1 FL=1